MLNISKNDDPLYLTEVDEEIATGALTDRVQSSASEEVKVVTSNPYMKNKNSGYI